MSGRKRLENAVFMREKEENSKVIKIGFFIISVETNWRFLDL